MGLKYKKELTAMDIRYIEIMFDDGDYIQISYKPKEFIIRLYNIQEFLNTEDTERLYKKVAYSTVLIFPNSYLEYKTNFKQSLKEKLYMYNIVGIYICFNQNFDRYYEVKWFKGMDGINLNQDVVIEKEKTTVSIKG